MIRSVRLVTIIAFVVLAAWLWSGFRPQSFRLTFFNVGQGDSALIQTPAKQAILIDGGPDRGILVKLGQALPWGKRTLDLVILSHPHADHVAGLTYVLERYHVRQVLMTGVLYPTPEYLRFLELVRDKHIPVHLAKGRETLKLAGGVSVDILWPQGSLANIEVADVNATSVVCRVNYGDTSVLFTGDTPAENEASLLATGVNLEADILKVAHQGSITSSTPDFIKAVAPELAVVSVGKNTYGHPASEIMERLRKLVLNVVRTDEMGDVTLKSDGRSWQRY